MLLMWNKNTRRWEVPFSHHENEGPGEGDGAGVAGGKGADDAAAKLKAENDALKKQLDDIAPRIKAIEDADKKRADDLAKKDEERKKKELGADKVLEERNEQLRLATERLSALEKRERERVDAAYEALPEDLREAVAPLKSTLPLEQWAEQVARLEKIVVDKGSSKKDSSGMFFKPGGGDDASGKQQLNPLSREILEGMGRDPEALTKGLLIKRVKDEESGRISSRFTHHVRDFFQKMNLQPVRRLDVKR